MAKKTRSPTDGRTSQGRPPTPRAPGARSRGGRKAARSAASGNGGRRLRRKGDALVIVESPTKAKTIGKYLGSGYAVMATIGHVRDLPTRKLGVEIENGTFTPEYVVIKGKSQTL